MNGVMHSAIGLFVFVVTSLLLGTSPTIVLSASLTWAVATLITKVNDD